MIDKFDIRLSKEIVQFSPLGFKESLYLWKDAALVMTDSGGLQEETTALGVPCMTLRENTERPITIEMGTNVLAGTKHVVLRNWRWAFHFGTSVPGLMTGRFYYLISHRMSENTVYEVYSVVERGEEKKPFWFRIGTGFVNKD